MTVPPKSINMFKAIPIKIPIIYFSEMEKQILKFIWKHKRPSVAKEFLSPRNNAGGITKPDFY
jgi:hypothetical protein